MSGFAAFGVDRAGVSPPHPQGILSQMKGEDDKIHPSTHLVEGLHLARSSAPQPVPPGQPRWLRLINPFFIWPKIPSAKRPRSATSAWGLL